MREKANRSDAEHGRAPAPVPATAGGRRGRGRGVFVPFTTLGLGDDVGGVVLAVKAASGLSYPIRNLLSATNS